LIARALEEDLGTGDVTAEATVPAELMARARILLKQPGVVFGLDVAEQVFFQTGVTGFDRRAAEGIWQDGVPLEVASIQGPARAMLAGERVALNFLGHLSGVSTLTARFVDAVAGTGARILDTRKTTPGLRLLEKQAVSKGGGSNHRIGLYDAILIKENHIAVAGGLRQAVEACREARPRLTVEVEAETITQVQEAIAAGADRILLDNMSPENLASAVAIRNGTASDAEHLVGSADSDHPAGSGDTGHPAAEPLLTGTRPDTRPGAGPELEASGGIDLSNVREVAETGVDFISIGALTHSAPVLDFSLLVEPV
jgi:nicotinate-nucleotide pyrophosphorylase (carboxylating)